ncbi:MAG: hypothetical protein WBK19_15875 [Azonexus sp.]
MNVAQVLLRLHFCEHALQALVATHPAPQKFRAAAEEIFESALSPNANPEFVKERDAFFHRLFVGSNHGHDK